MMIALLSNFGETQEFTGELRASNFLFHLSSAGLIFIICEALHGMIYQPLQNCYSTVGLMEKKTFIEEKNLFWILFCLNSCYSYGFFVRRFRIPSNLVKSYSIMCASLCPPEPSTPEHAFLLSHPRTIEAHSSISLLPLPKPFKRQRLSPALALPRWTPSSSPQTPCVSHVLSCPLTTLHTCE